MPTPPGSRRTAGRYRPAARRRRPTTRRSTPPERRAGRRWRATAGRSTELVVRRFLATLSPDATWATIKCTFDAGGEPYAATGGRLIDPGWRRVYPYSEAKENILPTFTIGERLPIRDVLLEEKQTQPPPRYSQSKLIQVMEELGLGTKSTRHEVIGKLVSRRYVQGNPLRPTLVGRAVTDALDNHADTITEPEMTRTLEEHMQLIKEQQRTREDVVTESREMLHRVFDELEAHEQEIGGEIMEQTAEEHTLGPCPVCGEDLRIRHTGASQFIGCTGYPDCRFNISLPGSMWGRAIRVDEVCAEHNLAHVRLIRKGAPPWNIGCPLCSHIKSNVEALAMMPGMTDTIRERLRARHVYAVYDIAGMKPENLAGIAGVTEDAAATLIAEAGEVLNVLRRRSELRKFLRKIVPPRRGRSHAKIFAKLLDEGIGDIRSLAGARASTLKKAGISEAEAEELLGSAREICHERTLKEAGVPAVSLKKYREAGITSPDAFCLLPIPYLANRTGLNPETVYKHVEKVCEHLDRPVPAKITKGNYERGREELLAAPGIGATTLEKLLLAGIYDKATLRATDPDQTAAITGIPAATIRTLIANVT